MSENGLRERITNYLSHGGLFNPEHMDHEKVRALLMECRDTLAGTYLSGVSGRLTVEQVEKIHEIIERYSTDVVDYETATDDINAALWPNAVALTSGDGSESAGLRERLLAKCDELDSRAKAFADNNQYYFRGVSEGFATAAKEFRALAALAPAISRPPTQGSAERTWDDLDTDERVIFLADKEVELKQALRELLPLAEAYLRSAPGHPDNAKLETARSLCR